MEKLIERVSPEVASAAKQKANKITGEMLRARRVALDLTPSEVVYGTGIDPQVLMEAERTGTGVDDIYDDIDMALDHMEALKANETH